MTELSPTAKGGYWYNRHMDKRQFELRGKGYSMKRFGDPLILPLDFLWHA